MSLNYNSFDRINGKKSPNNYNSSLINMKRQQSSSYRWKTFICQHAEPTCAIFEHQFLGPGEIGDAYGDDREEMGLTLLHQAADEYVRDLGRNKMSDSF